jgi:hypothetical protein
MMNNGERYFLAPTIDNKKVFTRKPDNSPYPASISPLTDLNTGQREDVLIGQKNAYKKALHRLRGIEKKTLLLSLPIASLLVTTCFLVVPGSIASFWSI